MKHDVEWLGWSLVTAAIGIAYYRIYQFTASLL